MLHFPSRKCVFLTLPSTKDHEREQTMHISGSVGILLILYNIQWANRKSPNWKELGKREQGGSGKEWGVHTHQKKIGHGYTQNNTLMFRQTRSWKQEKQPTPTFQQTVLFFNHTSLAVITVYVNMCLESLWNYCICKHGYERMPTLTKLVHIFA